MNIQELKKAEKDGKTIQLLCDEKWVDISKTFPIGFVFPIDNYKIKSK